MPRIPLLFSQFKNPIGKPSRNGIVETGFHVGGTIVQACDEGFSWYIGCEPSVKHYNMVKQKIEAKHYVLKNVIIENKLSKDFLTNLELKEPAIFFLDAHYSAGDTYKSADPIYEELSIIKERFSNLPHCVLIDDCRGRQGSIEKEAMRLFGNCKFLGDNYDLRDIAHIEV